MSEIGMKLVEEIRKLGRQNPQHSVEVCNYVDSEVFEHNQELNGVCIVGTAMVNLAILDPEKHKHWITENNAQVFETWVKEVGSPIEGMDFAEIEWVENVQAIQDGRHGIQDAEPVATCDKSWGRAVKFADRAVVL